MSTRNRNSDRENIATDRNGREYILKARRKAVFSDQFTLVFRQALVNLTMDKTLTGTDFRLLFLLLLELDFRTFNPFHQEVAKATLNMSQSACSKTLSRLVDAGALERQGNRNNREYRIHAKYFWRGGAALYHQHMRGLQNAQREEEAIKKDIVFEPKHARQKARGARAKAKSKRQDELNRGRKAEATLAAKQRLAEIQHAREKFDGPDDDVFDEATSSDLEEFDNKF